MTGVYAHLFVFDLFFEPALSIVEGGDFLLRATARHSGKACPGHGLPGDCRT
jgi:hypothetical protein